MSPLQAFYNDHDISFAEKLGLVLLLGNPFVGRKARRRKYQDSREEDKSRQNQKRLDTRARSSLSARGLELDSQPSRLPDGALSLLT